MEKLMSQIEEALIELVPRGWAVFNMPSESVNSAVALNQAGRGTDADELLAPEWRGDTYRTKRVCDRVWSMGAADGEYHASFVARARLLRLAREHHNRDEYAASILIVQSQIEGIATDVTENKKFFSARKSSQADVVNPLQLVSIEASLAALRSPYIVGVETTQSDGSISRHGAAHGRELAFDNEMVSAKTWSLLDAVVEWAMPRARSEADRRKSERQAETSGTDAVDEHGRRIDDREFAETRDVLRFLTTSAIGWWSRDNAFKRDLLDTVFSERDFVKRGLPADHGIEMRVSDDGQRVSFSRETVSGWVLGISTVANEGSFLEWLYAGPAVPRRSPLDQNSEWGRVWVIPPDWIAR
jgi:hypothetical protein